jgi:hypothetical protein
MTKNSTRKGLALGAIASLVLSGFAGSAANAVGVESLVQLAPTTGTEYAVVAGSNFELSAINSSNANTGNLSFLVTDTSGVIESGIDTQGREVTIASVSDVTVAVGSASISQTAILSSLPVGTKFQLGAIATPTGLDTTTIYTVSSSSTADLLVFDGGTGVRAAADASSSNVIVKVVREARNTTKNTFVVKTGTRDVAKKLVLTSPDDATRTVTVQAFVDQDNDGEIDSFENVSPVRTVTFVKRSELVTTTTMSVVNGDEFLTAKVKTVPVLNGQQSLAGQTDSGTFLRVGFTRQDAGDTALFNRNLAVWNDTSKEFSVTISLAVAAGNNIGDSDTASARADATWGASLLDGIAGSGATGAVASGSKVVTIVKADHGLRVGDKVTFGDVALNLLDNAEVTVTSLISSSSFTVGSATASPNASASGTAAAYTVTTYGGNQSITDRAFAGTYTAQAYIQGALAGAKATAEAITATSADVELSTVQSANVQAGKTGTLKVKTGTLTVPVTVSVFDEDEEAVSAGRPVVVTFTGAGFKINDKTGSQTLTTDANGQIALTVTHPTGVAASSVAITAKAENGPQGSLTLTWENQAYGLVDLNRNDTTIATPRAIVVGGSYTMNLTVMDQWFATAAAGDYRVLVTGAGTAQGVRTLVDGKTEITITDNGFEAAMSTVIALQKVTSGVWATVGSTTTVVTNVNKNTNSIVLGADGSSLYGGTADLSSPVAVKALAPQDRRLTTAAQPAYSESAEIFGKIQNAASSVGVSGAEVTITGPSSILFSNGSVDKVGSITVISDGSGNFGVTLYSTTAQKDTVITVTSLGKSATTKVTFTGTTTGGLGTTLVITAPDTVAPASTLQVKAKLTDSFGNAVASAPVRVTYTGPGIAFGALPTAVDALGELSFSVLLGGGDTGTITVVVSYDQNGDGDYVDAKDLNTTKVITVGAATAAPATDQKLTVGSFKGFVAIYALNYTGSKLSAKVAGKWLVENNLSRFERVVRLTGAAIPIVVDLYIDGKFVRTENIVTK